MSASTLVPARKLKNIMTVLMIDSSETKKEGGDAKAEQNGVVCRDDGPGGGGGPAGTWTDLRGSGELPVAGAASTLISVCLSVRTGRNFR